MKTPLLILSLAAFAAAQLHAADTDAAANAINALGIDLLAKTGGPLQNELISPYSIECALTMTYAGAAGKTREEMAAVLHLPKDDAGLNNSFAALNKELAGAADSNGGGPAKPIALFMANRLYGQSGYSYRREFLAVVKENYGAPLEQVDFVKEGEKSRRLINAWVEEQTNKRIADLIPADGISKHTRLVLVNAIYFKAAWESEFEKRLTRPVLFHVLGLAGQDVRMMINQAVYGYAKKEGYTAVGLPYASPGLQFLVLLPDDANGLPALEAKLTPALLADCAKLEAAKISLWMPKLKLQPPLMELSDELEALGMKTAFDDPQGSADFDGIAPRKPDEYLALSKVFHKTFLLLDEDGTEAAAATAVMMNAVTGVPQPPQHEVHVDRPFLFAIQDIRSGACLFLGRVTDPR